MRWNKASHLTVSGDDAVDFLIVGIASVPREAVSQVRISLEDALKHNSFDDDTQMDDQQVFRQLVGSQPDEDCWHVAGGLAAAVDQVGISAGNWQALLQHLGTTQR